jgi:membrane protein YdbS with pleckstrin-like domain
MVMTAQGQGEQVIWEGRPTWRAWAVDWVGGWILLPVLFGGVMIVSVWLRTKSSRWKLTSRRIEAETGWISKRVDTLELWRVRDVEFRQSIVERLVGVSRILVFAHDQRSPVIDVRGVPGDRSIYDQLMAAVMEARKQPGIVSYSR